MKARVVSCAVAVAAAALVTSGPASPASATPDAATLFARHCAECHGADRLGAIGPALLPQNLGRVKPAEAREVIARGRPASQMAGFADRLGEDEIAALAAFVFTPLAHVPDWGMAEIEASRIVHNDPATLPDRPLHAADPLNLFTVVEAGDHHVTILDGDRFEPLVRFPSRFALHGGAKYSPDGRFVYLASRDGWIASFDLYSLKLVAEARAGINTRNLAAAGDGRTAMVGNVLPHTLVVLEAVTLKPLKVIPVVGDKGKTSRVSAVYAAPPRASYIAALSDLAEIWEMSWQENPRPVARGLVHNYQPGMEEGDFDRGPFPVRRIRLDDYLDDFFFDPTYTNVVGAARNGKNGQVVNLNVGRKVAEIALDGMPHLASGITFEYQGRPVLATPHLNQPAISVIDMTTWKTIKRIPTLGTGFFLRSHEATPYAWADVFFGPDKDAMHVIDKRTLEIKATLRPEPGKTSAHVEFTRDGRHALVSIWETDGAIIVYDAASLTEVKRIPMVKPSGKYNVFNKITLEAGTSH